MCWVCRIAVIFAALPFAFWFLGPARDLLVDIQDSDNAIYWFYFFLSFSFYLVILYISARSSVAADGWVLPWSDSTSISEDEHKKLQEWYLWDTRALPFVVVVLAGTLVALAFYFAIGRLPNPQNFGTLQDMIARVESHLWWSIVWTVLVTLAVVSGIFLVYSVRTLSFKAPFATFYFRWPPFLPKIKVADGMGGTLTREELLRDRHREMLRTSTLVKNVNIFFFVAAFAVLALFFLTPSLALDFERGPLAFLLLSMWIPVFSALGQLGRKLRIPLTALVVIAIALLSTFVVHDNHQVSLTQISLSKDAASASPQAPADDLRPDIKQWIAQWRESVGCEADPHDRTCHRRPILIAASGGASRAAFFTASALGALMDRACGAEDKGCGPDENDFVRSVFAISSVSGSTLGAASWVTALSRAQHLKSGGKPDNPAVVAGRLPCGLTQAPQPALLDDVGGFIGRNFKRAHMGLKVLFGGEPYEVPRSARQIAGVWYGTQRFNEREGDSPKGRFISNWQDCLELSVAGDYLSPTIAHLLTRDVFPNRRYSDRNVALEAAFARQAADVFDRKRNPEDAPKHGQEHVPLPDFKTEFLTLYDAQITAARRRGDNQWKSEDTQNNVPWLPLLVSNGASVPYGNRILLSPIAHTRDASAGFLDSTDAHTLVKGGDCGFSVAAAITHSARFPIVSTEGDFPAAQPKCKNGDVTWSPRADCERSTRPRGRQPGFRALFEAECNRDQVVDGGYFESLGISTVFDLAAQLYRSDLHPYILLITNDPTVDLTRDLERVAQRETVFGAFGTPITGVVSARGSRARTTLQNLCRVIRTLRRDTHKDQPLVGADCLRQSKTHFGFITVAAVLEPADRGVLSLSWWLSNVVQGTLSEAVSKGENAIGMDKVCDVINRGATRVEGAEWTETDLCRFAAKPRSHKGAPAQSGVPPG